MKFIKLIAFRYIFSRKRHNTINLVTAVSMGGVAVGTMAIIIIMSVVNGLEKSVEESFSIIDPHIKISPCEGKTFSMNDSKIVDMLSVEGVGKYCKCIEHEGMITYGEKQSPGIIKGVDNAFGQMYDTDLIVVDGSSKIGSKPITSAMLGMGLANKLCIGVQYSAPINIYTAKRNAKINLARPEAAFIMEESYVCGIANFRQGKQNDNMAIVTIDVARGLFDYDSLTVSNIELMVEGTHDIDEVKHQIEDIAKGEYVVANRQEQQADFFRLLNIEKWITFLILAFILMIATFNVIGSLSMIIIEKKKDIELFYNLGAKNQTVIRLFSFTGWLITSIGAFSGLILGTILTLLQQHFGFIKMGAGLEAQVYPVELHVWDFLIVLTTVLIMSVLTSYLPVRAALKKTSASQL